MMNNNKILTVSYGTFSCTLEGFEDSFGTMKAIAEYFRDLAAEDRYFGAEPPQPDADMLTRIAQQGSKRRVEARQHDGKIMLSETSENTEARPALDAPVAAPVAAVAASAMMNAAAPDMEDVAAAELAADVDAKSDQDSSSSEETSADALTETAAQEEEANAVAEAPETAELDSADLAEETRVEDADTDLSDVDTSEDKDDHLAAEETYEFDETGVQVGAEDAAEAEETADDAPAEADAVEEAEAEDIDADAIAAQTSDDSDIVPGQPDAEVEAFFANSTSAETFEVEGSDDDTDNAAAPLADSADSIAAKLQRIRAVVAQHDDAEDDEDYVEDEHADASVAMSQDNETVIAQAREEMEQALAADEDAVESASAQDEEEISDILSRVSEADEVDGNLFDDDAHDADQTADLDDSAVASADASGTSQVTASDDLSLEAEDAAFDDDQSSAPRARVIKVKRAALKSAMDRSGFEEHDDADTAEATPPALDDLAPARVAETSLSADDEADLARELASLEADMHDDDTAETAEESRETVIIDAEEETAETAEEERKPRGTRLRDLNEGREEDVDRLLAETAQQMDEPESATRRDAFAHLRAAVAAKKADDALGTRETVSANDDAYRSDLADVVRPRRATDDIPRNERSDEKQGAPLKLVAEQRIDSEEPTSVERPQRVAAVDDMPAATSDAVNFAEFAADMGATKLPDLLEAAASYMSFVEGREQFSRPQLMTKVRQVGHAGFTREDGLRSFGQLLRAGKIEKIKGGRFTASDDIGFRPDERAAG